MPAQGKSTYAGSTGNKLRRFSKKIQGMKNYVGDTRSSRINMAIMKGVNIGERRNT
jgi:hypothetical protein